MGSMHPDSRSGPSDGHAGVFLGWVAGSGSRASGGPFWAARPSTRFQVGLTVGSTRDTELESLRWNTDNLDGFDSRCNPNCIEA